MLETTFGISVMEPWEKAVFLTFVTLLTLLIAAWLYQVLPNQLFHVQHRVAYYLFGHSSGNEHVLHWGDTMSVRDL